MTEICQKRVQIEGDAFHKRIGHKSIENDRNLIKKNQNRRRRLSQENSSTVIYDFLEVFLERLPFTREFFTKASKMTEICLNKVKIEGDASHKRILLRRFMTF